MDAGMNHFKVFTLAEANALLPRLSYIILELQTLRDKIQNKEAEIDALELISAAPNSGSSPLVQSRMEDYKEDVNVFYRRVEEMQETGCQLKDLDLGLVDFYYEHEGEMVYLCWHQGEPEVKFWHEIDRGFAHRKPISGPHPED